MDRALFLAARSVSADARRHFCACSFFLYALMIASFSLCVLLFSFLPVTCCSYNMIKKQMQGGDPTYVTSSGQHLLAAAEASEYRRGRFSTWWDADRDCCSLFARRHHRHAHQPDLGSENPSVCVHTCIPNTLQGSHGWFALYLSSRRIARALQGLATGARGREQRQHTIRRLRGFETKKDEGEAQAV